MAEGSGTGQLATFGAGCFWGVEEAFRHVEGVTATAAGYMGGTLDYPRYEDVCSGTTGHAEVVQVTYDPRVVSYDDLLAVFWSIHDPTQLNWQGPDYGTNYRSVIFYHTPEQEAAARASRDRLQQTAAYPHEENCHGNCPGARVLAGRRVSPVGNSASFVHLVPPA